MSAPTTGPQSILSGAEGNRQLFHHLLSGFVNLWDCAAHRESPDRPPRFFLLEWTHLCVDDDSKV